MKEGGVRVGTVMRERDGSGGVEGGGGGLGEVVHHSPVALFQFLHH